MPPPTASQPRKLNISDTTRARIEAFARVDDQLIAARQRVQSIREIHRPLEEELFQFMTHNNLPRTLIQQGKSSIATATLRTKGPITEDIIAEAGAEEKLPKATVERLLRRVAGKRIVKVRPTVRRILYNDQ